MSVDQDFIEHTLMEYYETCPNKHYHYEFITGNHAWVIGEYEPIHSHYSDLEERLKEVHDEIDKATVETKKKWKDKNKYNSSRL